MSTEKPGPYSPEEDAPREREINKQFFEGISEHIFQHVRKTLDSMLDLEGKKAWSRLIYSYPMLERVAVYTYSPVEAFDVRKTLLAKWAFADQECSDFRNPQVIQDEAFVINLLRHPDIAGKSIGAFLNRMVEDFYCVMQADTRKIAGSPDSIQALRDNWRKIEDLEGETRTTIDHSPYFRIQRKDLPASIEIHWYSLDGVGIEKLFTDFDAHLTEWFQWFSNCRPTRKPAKVFIYGPDGELVKPPGKHENPFPFDLIEKYDGLLVSEYAKELERRDYDDSDFDKNDLVFIFLEKVIREWKGDRAPAAHFPKYLRWRMKDAFRGGGSSEIPVTETLHAEEDDSKDTIENKLPGPQISPADEIEQKDRKEKLQQVLAEMEQERKVPVEKVILRLWSELLDRGDAEIPTDSQIQERLKSEIGQEISKSAARKARDRIRKQILSDQRILKLIDLKSS